MYFGHPFFGGFFHLLTWITVIFLIVWFLRRSHHCGGKCSHHTENSALNILKERYAKGEIGKEELDQKKNDLGV